MKWNCAKTNNQFASNMPAMKTRNSNSEGNENSGNKRTKTERKKIVFLVSFGGRKLHILSLVNDAEHTQTEMFARLKILKMLFLIEC